MTAPGDDARAEAGRLAVMQAMGWSDDRSAAEYAGAMWDLAGEVAAAVVLAGAALPSQSVPAEQREREQAVIAAARVAVAWELGKTCGPRYPVRRALIDAVDRLDTEPHP